MKAPGLQDMLAGDRVRVGTVGRDDAGKPSAPSSRGGIVAMWIKTDCMAPVYRRGHEILMVPCRSANAGGDYIMVSGRGTSQRIRLGRLVRVTAAQWHLQEFNPARTRRLARSTWRPLFRVTGTVASYGVNYRWHRTARGA